MPHRLAHADPLLRPFLDASDGPQVEREIAHLLSQVASPVIRDVLRGRLHSASEWQSADDLLQDALLQLTTRLRHLRARGAGDTPIEQFKGYVAVVALRVCDAFVRQRFPHRRRFRNRIRYVLTRHPACALEPSADGMECRLRRWGSGRSQAGTAGRLRALAASADLPPALRGADIARMPLADILPAVLEWVGGPVKLEDLTSALAELLGVREAETRSTDTPEYGAELPAARSASHADRFESRSYLRWLWAEIQQLPLRQRAALLLNLRDDTGGSALPLLVLTGVATMAAVASALTLALEDLHALWPRLPIDDATIAERLGVSRQQVINLRKSARLRLLRRSRRAGVGCAERETVTAIPPGSGTSV